MKNKLKIALLVGIIFGINVYAKDVYDAPEITPVINQLYPSKNELSIKVAYFPIGAFNKHLGIGGSYLSLENPNHGWEIISGYYFLEIPSGLKSSVIDSFSADPGSFPVLRYMIKTGYTYVPFYSKSILFNSSLVHSRSYLNVSAGLSDFKIESPPFISFGYGQNFYFGNSYGTKFEVDYVQFFKKNNYIQNQLTISAGIVFSWGADD